MQHFLLHIFSETEPHAHRLLNARGPLNRGALGHGLVGLCLNPALATYNGGDPVRGAS